VINLAVQDFISSLYDPDFNVDFADVLDKIREFAKGIRKSTLRWESFQQTCTQFPDVNACTIPLDTKVRWNSVYRMIEATIYLRKPIRRFLEDVLETDEDFYDRTMLTDREWELLDLLFIVLFPFKLVSNRFEGNAQTPEIDFLFLAYDRLFNHIDDVIDSFNADEGGPLANHPAAPMLRQALNAMSLKLNIHHYKTTFPYVYGDAMILNPRCKLEIFKEGTWSDIEPAVYVDNCRQRFERDYHQHTPAEVPTTAAPKRTIEQVENDNDEDAEFRQLLRARRTANPDDLSTDFDRYISIPNDPDIKSCLGYWRVNHGSFPSLAKMARDVLAVPVSGCSVERLFSVSGRVASWQRARLHDTTISDLMVYKAAQKLPNTVIEELMYDENEDLQVDETGSRVPAEWGKNWWKKKLENGRSRVRLPAVADRFISR
jgi:hAT family C-terminal dimerisation region